MDRKSTEILQLFKNDQMADSPAVLSVYRSNVEKVLGADESLYKISFVSLIIILYVLLDGSLFVFLLIEYWSTCYECASAGQDE
jgi:uncharacterized membrane-anchored protein